jgi:hypothetical protein
MGDRLRWASGVQAYWPRLVGALAVGAALLAVGAALLIAPAPASALGAQQLAKLVGDCTRHCGGPQGTGEINIPFDGGGFGFSVALNAAGTSALVGAPYDDSCGNCGAASSAPGAAWIFTAAGATWSQSGPKLVGNCKLACGGL